MKIAILGPVTTPKYFGGVATFDENLAIAYKRINQENDVFLYSKQIDKAFSDHNGIVHSPINLLSARKIRAFDLIIASLDYAVYLPLISARNKIYFLHGFFTLVAYSPLKTILAVAYQKFFLRYADYIIGNSKLTCFINREIYNINSQGTACLGVSYDYLKQLALTQRIKKEKNTILYAGRLVKAKHVFHIIKAIEILNKKYQNKFMLRIVGDGEQRSELEEYVRKNDLNVKFYGRVSQSDIVEFYKKSDMFISLNPAEPFGITFCEALLAGCKIICPDTGGQVEFLTKYPHTVHMISDFSEAFISKAVEKLSNESEKDTININEYRYESTAKAILRIVGENDK